CQMLPRERGGRQEEGGDRRGEDSGEAAAVGEQHEQGDEDDVRRELEGVGVDLHGTKKAPASTAMGGAQRAGAIRRAAARSSTIPAARMMPSPIGSWEPVNTGSRKLARPGQRPGSEADAL